MKSVLIIEDDHDLRVLLRSFLEAQGYWVFSTGSGPEGLRILRKVLIPSAIVLDQNLPMMSGEEFLVIKQADAKLAPIPVVVISSDDDRTQGLGARAFLKKPLELGLVLASIEACLLPQMAG